MVCALVGALHVSLRRAPDPVVRDAAAAPFRGGGTGGGPGDLSRRFRGRRRDRFHGDPAKRRFTPKLALHLSQISPSIMTSFLTASLGDFLGDAVAAGLGIEHTDFEFEQRAVSVFKAADTDNSQTLDFSETLAALKLVPGLKTTSEDSARNTFARFALDGNGTLGRDEFKKLSLTLRRTHQLNQMGGLIYCGGVLMNPLANPLVAERLRLKQLYSKPYAPQSALAKAIAKKTYVAINSTVASRGRLDQTELDQLSDDEDNDGAVNDGASSFSVFSLRKIRNAKTTGNDYYSIASLEFVYFLCLLTRFCVAIFGTSYVHPDEYHQTVEVAASRVFGINGSPRVWEFTDANPIRSLISVELAAGASYRIFKFLWKFDQSALLVFHSVLHGLAAGCDCLVTASRFASLVRALAHSLKGNDVATTSDLDATFPALFLAPRVFNFFSSLLLDVAVSTTAQAAYWSGVPRNCKNTRLNGHQRNTLAGASHAGLHARLLLASSWPVLALVAKPFTNSVECVLVAVLLLVVVGVGAGDDVDGDVANSCLSKQSQTAETTTTTNSGVTKQQSPTATRKRERKARVRDVAARAFVAGAVCAIGTWTRFTFPCFAVPLLLALLTNAGSVHGGTRVTKLHGVLVASCAALLGGVLLASVLIVADTAYFRGPEAVRVVFFGDHDATVLFQYIVTSTRDVVATTAEWFKNPSLPPLDVFSMVWRASVVFVGSARVNAERVVGRAVETDWVVTPLNAVSYNSRKHNLRKHGLHNRLTHVCVNFPLLFGPTALFFCGVVARSVWRATKKAFAKKQARSQKASEKKPSRTPTAATALHWALLWAVLLPLAVLSTAPHQEPRFLLPVAAPLVSLAAAHGASFVVSGTTAALVVLGLHNAIGTYVFGLAHQSGVVPALRALPELTSGASAAALSNDSRKSGTKYEEGDDARDASNKKTVLFWRTYPPPLALLANFAKKPEPRERVGFEPKTTGYSKPRRRLDVSSVLDLQGASVQALLETVSKSDTARGTFLVAPVTAAAEFSTFVSARRGAGADGNGDGVVTLRLIWKRGGHFSGEELGGLRDAFEKKGVNGMWHAAALGVYVVEKPR